MWHILDTVKLALTVIKSTTDIDKYSNTMITYYSNSMKQYGTTVHISTITNYESLIVIKDVSNIFNPI